MKRKLFSSLLRRPSHLLASLIAVPILPLVVAATPIITSVVETGGDNEATDTVTAKWTGVTFVSGVANEPIRNTAVDASYTVGLFVEDCPSYVDRAHQWNGATAAIGLPAYLLNGEYIMSGNDNRDNTAYRLEVTVSSPVNVYLLIDDRLGDGDNLTPPTFSATNMQWVVDEGWQAVSTGLNRHGNASFPDHVGIDEDGTLGVGPGVEIQQWHSIYKKSFPAGTFTLRQADNASRNMYGVVVTSADDPANLPPSITYTNIANNAIFYASDSITFSAKTYNPNTIQTANVLLFLNGTNVSASLTFTGNTTNRVATYTGLLPNRFYTASAVATDSQGRSTTNTISFDTFSETTTVVIENEDYNYGTDGSGNPVLGICAPGDPGPGASLGGGFQNNPPPSGFSPTPPFPGFQVNGNGVGYLDTYALVGIDYFDTSSAVGDLNTNPYRTCDPVGVTANTDFFRQKYIDAGVGRIWDMHLHQMQTNEWLNYTRTFANTNYQVYLRVRAGAAQQVSLSRVTGDRTQPNQTLAPLGTFNVPVDAAYTYVPLSDPVGNPIVISLSGVQTLRMTALTANNNLNPNFIMLVPTAQGATIFGPVISSATPAPDAVNVAAGASINITITNRVTTLNVGSVQLSLDGSVAPATVTPNALGATVFYQPATFTPGSVHTVKLTYSDNQAPANSFTNEWSFTVTTDVGGPSLVAAVPRDQAHKVLLTFSETLSKASAETIANYTITNAAGVPLAIVSATLESSGSNVTLITAKQAENAQYAVVANVRDAVNNPGGGTAPFTSWVYSPGFLLREFYSITTASLDALMAHPAFPANPSSVSYLTSAETPSGVGDNYAQRVSGLLLPPESGGYTFFLSSDDHSLFYLSTDESPANKVLIAQETSYTSLRTWTGDRTDGTRGSPPSNISTNAIQLTAGQKYYFELVHREGTGGDHLGLNWQLPSQGPPENASVTRITSEYIASYADAAGASVTITQQPANRLVSENQTATFTVGVEATGTPLAYQWQVSTDAGGTWNNISGANGASYITPLLMMSDSNTRYRVIASVPGASATSASATVTVSDDTAPPMLRYRADANFVASQVILYYSELMDPGSAANALNYFIEGPGGSTLDVLSAQMSPNGSNVVLTTAAMVQGERYEVTVVGPVLDLVGNQVAPNNNGQTMAVFYAAGTFEFAAIDIGPAGRAPAGWLNLPSTPAAGANAMNYPTTQLTANTGAPFTIAIDNMSTAGTATGNIDWRDRGDSTSTATLAAMAEDLVKNNAGVIHVTLGGLPAGTYQVTSYHMDMTPGGANQSDNVRVFVNGVEQMGVRGNADQVLALNTLTDQQITNSAANFEITSDGVNPVNIHFDGRVNISRTDTETPLNGLVLRQVAGSVPSPIITLTAPTSGELFQEGVDIVVSADASPSHPEDPITVVEFFANGVKIGEDTTAPYAITWNAVPRGMYAVQAVVTDKLGIVVESEVANIVVDSSAPVLEYAWASVDDLGAVKVTLQFDEPLSPTTATDLVNYGIVEPGPEIVSVSTGHASNSIVLDVTGLASNTFYTVEVVGVSDNYGNTISQATYQFALPILQINYQLAGAPVPPGYLVDEGWEFGDRTNGYFYGWSTNATDDTRDRNNVNEPDQRYDTLSHFQRGEDMHVWEVALPNGTYDVFVAAGDPSNTDQTNHFNIEGVVVLDPDGRDNYDQYLATVEVTDGRLTIMPAEMAFNSKIMFVNIAASAGGTPTLGPLTITRSGSNITITWNGPGRLQEATEVTGPYTDVFGNPASGYTVPATGPQKFYRLIQ